MFQTIAAAVRKLNPRCVVFALDGGHAHRFALLPSYKAHRPPAEPELVRQRELAEKAIELVGWQAIRVPDFEADDVIASIVAQHRGVVVCSSDKDLLALAGRARIFHPWNGGEFVEPETKLGLPAGQVTDFLALCGDTSDGIPGVKGIGPKTALSLLSEFGSLEGILAAAMTGEIKGANGARLKEQTAEALKARQLVELRDSLPIPELRNTPPRPGWQQHLQALRLASVTAIVETLGSITPPEGEAASAPTGKGEPANDGAADNPERSAAERKPDQLPGTEKPGDGTSTDAEAVAGNTVRRSISEPIRTGLSAAEYWDGPDRGLILCWESGRQAAAKEHPPANPWRNGTANAKAWQQGFELRDLDTPAKTDSGPAPEPPGSTAPNRRERTATTPAKPRQPSLF